ncbi:hypothetical protein DYBT9275_01341 [Dyadobacter sp. CECT 9275]|uniref:ATP-grasp domain-containing protein n=1 Tax=Dyadobacter helix TaxID=2822344 RepID=A0A916J8R2_9BACT|nr:hypothetical protein [Dyadobacter sp. CECT 9275]CAG4994194.1 hypothetical protein DYBT9275_01341 [Dyadobacter sp. CECT 9275]
MEHLEILAVSRNKKYSPNHIGNDEAIFSLTLAELQKMGCKIQLYDEDEFLAQEQNGSQHIMTMARQKQVVKKLQSLEYRGAKVVNSGFSIENSYRINMHKALEYYNIPVPRSLVVSTFYNDAGVFDGFPFQQFWVKRGDFHAMHREDVTFVSSRQEGHEILREYGLRDIQEALVSEHLTGDLVKFYGVRSSGFFYWFYPFENKHHKYTDYENINGQASHYVFDTEKLKVIANAAAIAVGVEVYGGDAIVDKDGNFKIIDLNDWPSFAPCREEAAPYIASAVFNRFTENTREPIRHKLPQNNVW